MFDCWSFAGKALIGLNCLTWLWQIALLLSTLELLRQSFEHACGSLTIGCSKHCNLLRVLLIRFPEAVSDGTELDLCATTILGLNCLA